MKYTLAHVASSSPRHLPVHLTHARRLIHIFEEVLEQILFLGRHWLYVNICGIRLDRHRGSVVWSFSTPGKLAKTRFQSCAEIEFKARKTYLRLRQKN